MGKRKNLTEKQIKALELLTCGKGLTYTAIAQEVGVDRDTIWRWLNQNDLFKEAYKIFIDNNEDIFESGTKIINTLKDDPKYTNLINLIRLYRYTSKGVFFNEDPTWMPAQMK